MLRPPILRSSVVPRERRCWARNTAGEEYQKSTEWIAQTWDDEFLSWSCVRVLFVGLSLLIHLFAVLSPISSSMEPGHDCCLCKQCLIVYCVKYKGYCFQKITILGSCLFHVVLPSLWVEYVLFLLIDCAKWVYMKGKALNCVLTRCYYPVVTIHFSLV